MKEKNWILRLDTLAYCQKVFFTKLNIHFYFFYAFCESYQVILNFSKILDLMNDCMERIIIILRILSHWLVVKKTCEYIHLWYGQLNSPSGQSKSPSFSFSADREASVVVVVVVVVVLLSWIYDPISILSSVISSS